MEQEDNFSYGNNFISDKSSCNLWQLDEDRTLSLSLYVVLQKDPTLEKTTECRACSSKSVAYYHKASEWKERSELWTLVARSSPLASATSLSTSLSPPGTAPHLTIQFHAARPSTSLHNTPHTSATSSWGLGGWRGGGSRDNLAQVARLTNYENSSST